MREPPHFLDEAPDEELKRLFEELIRASNTIELLVGVYRVVKPALIRALNQHLAQANPLSDYPTCRLLRLLLKDEEEMVVWGTQATTALTQAPEAAKIAHDWEKHLSWFLDAAGGIAGDLPNENNIPSPCPRSDGSPYTMDSVPRRDQRFRDSLNRSAAIDEYYQDISRDADERMYALLYKRLREMDVPEWMGPILFKTQGKPWEYYQDLSRQLWDEARHAMMGEVGLYAKGVPFYRYPLDITSSLSLNKSYEPLEAHIILWGIEQNLMPKETGKRWEWEIAFAAGDELVTRFQDYDWADEVLHAQIGRKWLIPELGSRHALLSAWERLRERWDQSREALFALSKQDEWWPEFLAEVRYHHTSKVPGKSEREHNDYAREGE
ncbi:hypothetical protein [Ktedonobacter sp. SOSP1-52]|uniref:hypothetical protein n=1 Tax=Ktedonobacter sp. SOSP1-52 TaxID=2778366 RepID=UPI0019166B4A|nr:hypothetical protein [Ktedonobacter sp. SOSP1-52]